MNDSFGDFNSTQTATGSGGAAAEQKPEGIASVFIKQVVESPEGNFQLFGMTFGMVCAVGIVRKIETSSTKITYLLEDHTGRIDAHSWLEEGDAEKTPNIIMNQYVKVYGTVRSQSGRKTLMIFKITSILDPNEIVTHVLEALQVRYKSEELHAKGDGGFTGMGTNRTDAGGFGGGGSNGGQEGSIEAGLEGKQLAVYQAIKTNMTQEGISRKELKSKFSHISDFDLNKMLDFMISEGHIYSSIDADHFISTM